MVQLREAADDQLKAVIDLAYLTGMRKGDLLTLRLADLSPRRHDRVRARPVQGRGGRPRQLVMTEWDVYRTLDYERIYASMEKPPFVFDGRNILDHERLFAIGFNVRAIGKRPLMHF